MSSNQDNRIKILSKNKITRVTDVYVQSGITTRANQFESTANENRRMIHSVNQKTWLVPIQPLRIVVALFYHPHDTRTV